MTGARYQIAVDGQPRSNRDDRAIAIEAAEYLKHKHPHAEVTVHDLVTGDTITIKTLPPGRLPSLSPFAALAWTNYDVTQDGEIVGRIYRMSADRERSGTRNAEVRALARPCPPDQVRRGSGSIRAAPFRPCRS
jgi:hypothetical protein